MSEPQIPENAGRDLSNESFEQFLASVGLSLYVRRGPQGEPYGNWIIQYANADLAVSMIFDRGDMRVTIADKNTLRPNGIFPPAPAAYDVELISESLAGIPPKPLTFDEQKAFVRTNWHQIFAMFSPESRRATYDRLSLLGRERMKRTLKPWPPVIAEFEEFLRNKNLICDAHEAPDGALGDRLLAYHNDVLNVKVASEGGWTLTFADRAARPEAWYNIGTIRKLLVRDADARFPFTEWFVFASANWNAITALFAPEQREESHRRLGPLEEETIRRRQLAREQQAAQLEELARRVRQGPTQ